MRAAVAVIAVALLGVHLWLTSSMDGALVSDGMAYLANARWLGGAGETWMGGTGFYHAGYSLVIAPLFAALDEPDAIFRGVLVVNSVLASASFVVYWLLAQRLGLTRWTAVGAALVAALYPSVLLQSSIEWSESLYHLVFALVLLALHHLATGGGAVAGALTGLGAAYLYAIHPRALGVLGALVVGVAWFARRRQIDRRAAAAALGALVVGFVAVRAGHAAIVDALWAGDRTRTESDVLSRLTEARLVRGMALRIIGHAWYLLVASFGLVVAAGVWLWRRRLTPFAPLVALMCAGTMAAGALMMSNARRVDHLVYGRYNEGFLPALLVVGVAGLVELARRRQVLQLALTNVVAVATLGVATVATNGGDRFTGEVMPLNVVALLAWESDRSHVDVLAISVVAAVISVAVVLARTVAVAAAVVAVALTFAATSVRADRAVIEPWAAFWSSVTELPTVVEELPTDEPVVYRRDSFVADAGIFYQFELLDRIDGFWETDEAPAADLVIARASWPDAGEHGARVVYRERRFDQAVWVLPGEVADALDDAGFVVDGALGDAIDHDALDARLDVGDVAARAGAQLTLSVRVAHPQGGDPWPGLGDLESEDGAVRVVAQLSDGTSAIGDLPRMLLPGQSADVPVFLPVPDAPGTYELEVSLVQVGNGAFRGSRTVTVDVTR